MDATLAAVEQACREFQHPATRPAAEQVLLQFRRSPQPLAACRHILDHSSLLEAQFHAASTMREGMLRQWALLGPQDIQELRTYILGVVLRSSDSPQFTVVRSALLAALAVMLKRMWEKETGQSRMAFMQEIHSAVSAVGSAAAQRTGVEVLEAIVSEFSLATASSLGLPMHYHEQCHLDMETDFLRGFCSHAVNLAKQAVASGAVERGEDAGTCAACMSLITCILSWEFRCGFGASPLNLYRLRKSDSIQVRLPPQWLEMVLSEDSIGWLLQLLPKLRAAHGSSANVAARARQLMVLLCMICSASFPRPGPTGTLLREAHLGHCLHGLLLWIHPPEAALQFASTQNEDELLDACRGLSALALTHNAINLERVGASNVFQTLDSLTCGLLMAGGVTDEAKGTWVGTCTELLLEMWLSLLQPGCSLKTSQLPTMAVEAATHVFLVFTDCSLKDFAAGAHEVAQDDDEEEAAGESRKEWMAHAAALARCNPGVTFPALRDHILQRKQLLYSLAAQGADASECLEQLCWLLDMAATCLADDCPGETPLLPEAVLAAVQAGHTSAIEGLSHALLDMCALVLQEGAVHVLSPRLMEAAVTALSRWVDTYLCSEDAQFPDELSALFGPDAAGRSILEMCVKVATTCLASYPGERELHKQVCAVLLDVLVKHPKRCHVLVGMDCWHALTHAFASRQPQLTQQLHQKMHRHLAYNLCRAAAGYQRQEDAAAYTRHVMGSVAREVGEVTQRPGFGQVAARADVTQQVCCLLESLRGASRSSTGTTHDTLFLLFLPVLPALLVLHSVFSASPLVVGLLLKMVADMVESGAFYLKLDQFSLFMEWVHKLLQQYAASAGSTLRSITAASALQQDQAEAAARELRALMLLLTNVLQRDWTDMGEGAADPARLAAGQNGTAEQQAGGGKAPVYSIGVAQVVLQGLHCILPLMSEELLKYPKLGGAFFELLSQLGDTWPQHVAALPADQFGALMRSLQGGLKSSDSTCARPALEALAGLSKWHLKQVKGGKPGLDASQAGGSPGVGAHFMEVVLQRLLLEDNPADLVDAAADALLPLLFAQPAAFDSLAGSIVATQSDAKAQAAVHGAMADMVQSLGAQGEMNRNHRMEFRDKLATMVASVRGLMFMR